MDIKKFKEKLDDIFDYAVHNLSRISNSNDLKQMYYDYFGRNGLLNRFFKDNIKNLDDKYKPEAGDRFNKIKELLLKEKYKFEHKLSTLKTKKEQIKNILDVTLPGRKINIGYKHPISKTIEDCVNIFRRVGFIAKEGPSIETVENCFNYLNVPKDHPSRSMTDTFYLSEDILLRTHTSTVQIRTMKDQKPPIRIISPGVCFRSDELDATHSFNFHQLEGLYVDKNVSLSDLKDVLLFFARELFGKKMSIRLRPHFFPFTEPSVEYDFMCVKCKGKGCDLCKNSGWIEISGAGIVNPKVFKNVGYDPNIWSGFAFGMGIERITMIRYAINDIRFLYDNNIKFLTQN